MRVASWIPEFFWFLVISVTWLALSCTCPHISPTRDCEMTPASPLAFQAAGKGTWKAPMQITGTEEWGDHWDTPDPRGSQRLWGWLLGRMRKSLGLRARKSLALPKVEPNPVAVRKWTWWERRKAWSPPHAISESKESVRNRARTSNVRFSKIIWPSSPCISWMGKRFN